MSMGMVGMRMLGLLGVAALVASCRHAPQRSAAAVKGKEAPTKAAKEAPKVVSKEVPKAAPKSVAKETPKAAPKMGIATGRYGFWVDGRDVLIYTLTNANGLRVKLIPYGAITVGVEVPDRTGKLSDVTLGFDDLDGWLGNSPYFGATVGRYANRIAKGMFKIEKDVHRLARNNGPNALHGGYVGFDKVIWNVEPVQTPNSVGIKFTRLSPDGEEGYPGNLSVTAVYSLTNDNEFKIEFSATTDKPTIVNMAHHSYWNLGGPEAGNILGHELMINADQYTPVDANLIPTGELKDVKGTPFDFTTPTAVGARIAQVEGGYDHNFVLRREEGKLFLAARLYEPKSGRVMEIFTDQPGLQFYAGNFLDGKIKGKHGIAYGRNWALCLETQKFPDSPNHADWPPATSPLLKPGETYRHTMIHKFSVK